MKTTEETKRQNDWVAKKFGIQPEQVIGYNSGSSYDKVWVRDRATAEKVSKRVSKETCNGGYFHGMNLGNISKYDGKFEVMC
jgi:hypothetical protein